MGHCDLRNVVDNPDKAKAALDRQRSDYKETNTLSYRLAAVLFAILAVLILIKFFLGSSK